MRAKSAQKEISEAFEMADGDGDGLLNAHEARTYHNILAGDAADDEGFEAMGMEKDCKNGKRCPSGKHCSNGYCMPD